MVTGSSDVDRYLEQDGKLVHTTTPGLVKYDATTGQALGDSGVCRGIGRSSWISHAQRDADQLRRGRGAAGI